MLTCHSVRVLFIVYSFLKTLKPPSTEIPLAWMVLFVPHNRQTEQLPALPWSTEQTVEQERNSDGLTVTANTLVNFSPLISLH